MSFTIWLREEMADLSAQMKAEGITPEQHDNLYRSNPEFAACSDAFTTACESALSLCDRQALRDAIQDYMTSIRGL